MVSELSLGASDGVSTKPTGPIVHVINALRPGGAEKQLEALVRRSALRHEVLELETWYPEPRARWLSRLAGRLRGMSPGVIVAWLDRPQIAVAMTAPRQVPLVACVRGMPRRPSGLQRLSLQAALARYGLLITNATAVRDATRAFMRPVPLRHFEVIPNGVEAAAARIAGGTDKRGPMRVGFIGRDTADKGLDLLLRALDPRPERSLELSLVGPGVPAAVAAWTKPLPRWRASGRVDDPWATIGPIDVLVVPSRREGTPNVVLEAMARGVPVLGTDAGGMPALLADGRGIVVPRDDPIALRHGLDHLLDDPGLARAMTTRARDHVTGCYDWPTVIAQWDRLLSQAAARAR